MDFPDIGYDFGQIKPGGSDNVASVTGNVEASDEAGSDVPNVNETDGWRSRLAVWKESVKEDEVRGECAMVPSRDDKPGGEGPDEEGGVDRCNADVGMLVRQIPESLLSQYFGYDIVEHVVGGLGMSELSRGGDPVIFCTSRFGVCQVSDAACGTGDRYLLDTSLDRLLNDVDCPVHGSLARSPLVIRRSKHTLVELTSIV